MLSKYLRLPIADYFGYGWYSETLDNGFVSRYSDKIAIALRFGRMQIKDISERLQAIPPPVSVHDMARVKAEKQALKNEMEQMQKEYARIHKYLYDRKWYAERQYLQTKMQELRLRGIYASYKDMYKNLATFRGELEKQIKKL